MNINNVKNCLEKVKMYDKEQMINFCTILDLIQSVNENYKTSNFDKLVNIQQSLDRKFEIIEKNNTMNEIIIFNNIQKQSDAARETVDLFREL